LIQEAQKYKNNRVHKNLCNGTGAGQLNQAINEQRSEKETP